MFISCIWLLALNRPTQRGFPLTPAPQASTMKRFGSVDGACFLKSLPFPYHTCDLLAVGISSIRASVARGGAAAYLCWTAGLLVALCVPAGRRPRALCPLESPSLTERVCRSPMQLWHITKPHTRPDLDPPARTHRPAPTRACGPVCTGCRGRSTTTAGFHAW